jgi:hypothetical protein
VKQCSGSNAGICADALFNGTATDLDPIQYQRIALAPPFRPQSKNISPEIVKNAN